MRLKGRLHAGFGLLETLLGILVMALSVLGSWEALRLADLKVRHSRVDSRITELTREKIAVLAPMPSPSATTAVTMNEVPPCRNMRSAWRRSRSKVPMKFLFRTVRKTGFAGPPVILPLIGGSKRVLCAC